VNAFIPNGAKMSLTVMAPRIERIMQHKFYFALFILNYLIWATSCVSLQTGAGTYRPFIKAVQAGDIVEADRLLREGHFPSQVTVGNQTALHIAAAEGNNEMLTWLLAREANPFLSDQNGRKPADFARRQGNTDTERLIAEYIQLLQEEEEAIVKGDIERLRTLLARDYRQYTILHVLAQLGDAAEIQRELQRDIDVDARTTLEMTPLHKATIPQEPDAARLLLAAGADVNAVDVWKTPPIYYAVLRENVKLVEILLQAGANLDIQPVFSSETVEEYAERKGNQEILDLIALYHER
jgi:ankyrin repeat protein